MDAGKDVGKEGEKVQRLVLAQVSVRQGHEIKDAPYGQGDDAIGGKTICAGGRCRALSLVPWTRDGWLWLPSGLLINEDLGGPIIVKQELIILVLLRGLQLSGLEAHGCAPPGWDKFRFGELHSFIYLLPSSFTHKGS